MPASVAHMLIAHKGLKELKELQGSEDKELAYFAETLDNDSKPNLYRAYMNLGSLGPDLYYYTSLAKGIKDFIIDRFFQAAGVTPWSYHLHSNRPNEFPLKLIQIMFSDMDRRDDKKVKIGENDMDTRKLAYIAGHLSHIAADQIIHPVVNDIAGPYYTSGQNRKKHREVEVYQDYFLYQVVYCSEREKEKKAKENSIKYEFFKQDFRGWVDCVRGMTTKNTEDWFRYFLQRGFIETYGAGPDEDEIEDAVDGLLMTFLATKMIGPYKKADEEYKKDGTKGENFMLYVEKPQYREYYRKAVDLTKVYITVLYKTYELLQENKYDEFSDKRRWFLKVIRDADLSCPLEKDILKNANDALGG